MGVHTRLHRIHDFQRKPVGGFAVAVPALLTLLFHQNIDAFAEPATPNMPVKRQGLRNPSRTRKLDLKKMALPQRGNGFFHP
jgi:hypothetical protein